MYNYCQIYTGGSLQGAIKLNSKESDVVINWAGGKKKKKIKYTFFFFLIIFFFT